MTDQNTPAPSRVGMRPGLRALLIGSLALNLLVVGVIGGGMIAGRGMPLPFGGPDMNIGPFAAALDGRDRDIIRDELRRRVDTQRLRRGDRTETMNEFLAALRADPFDPAPIEQIFLDQRAQATAALTAGQEVLLDRITEMTPQGRADFAEKLGRQFGGSDHR